MATLEDTARAIIDANTYLTLATAGADGQPWASPVWYAHADYREFLWVSRPDARHSQNLAARAQLAIVIFDISMSLDGFMTAANQTPEEPIGEGGPRLITWAFGVR